MAGNPADERFRPPDPPLETGNPTIQSKNQDVADSASSSSSQRREKAVHVATIEADIDASRHNNEKDLNLSCKEGESERGEKQMGDGKIASQNLAAKSSLRPGQSHDNRQESHTGELSRGCDSYSQQIGGKNDRMSDSRQEGEEIASQGRENRNRDGQNPQRNRSIQNQQRNPNLNKEKEIDQQRNPTINKDKEIEQQNSRSTRFLASKDDVQPSNHMQAGILSSAIPTKAHMGQDLQTTQNLDIGRSEMEHLQPL